MCYQFHADLHDNANIIPKVKWESYFQRCVSKLLVWTEGGCFTQGDKVLSQSGKPNMHTYYILKSRLLLHKSENDYE